MSAAAKRAIPHLAITPRDVAIHLYDHGLVSLPALAREEDLTVAIVQAFRSPYEGQSIRLSELTARASDFKDIRRYLKLIILDAERYGRSLECDRYRPAFVKPVGRM